MEKGELAKKGTYVGTGAGMILFLLVGIFPGSLVGGAVGLFISNLIMGGAVASTIVPRMIVAVSMVAGVIGSAALFVVGMSLAGWVVGSAIEVMRASQAAGLEEAKQEASK